MKKITEYPNADENETLPRISLIMPFEMKMKNKAARYDLLAAKADSLEKELLNDYLPERVVPVINKLRNMIKTVLCPVNGKSVGIFVSPVTEKIYYFSPSHLEDYKLPVLVLKTTH